ncbi:hypothetical protein HPP05_14625 [Corallococcus exiguus]|uniref:hypothetical protein n=1 Tax=Corallococcus exiguus TaxID=83462 RepID=UPI001493DF48|nr:hypothetical protein [Corallococcus exiguus]NPC70985.1 hypothetical protein [Corallococcus exiguus]
MNLESLLASLVPDPEACRKKAEELRSAFPDASPEELAERLIRQAKVLLAAAGGGSGLIANPIAAAPLALAETGVVLKTEANLVGSIVALLDPDVLKDPGLFTTEVLAIVFPSAASQALREFTTRAGQATSRALIRRYISKGVLKALQRFALKYLGLKLTQRAIITKTVPLVGAGIGATWNWVEVQRVGKRAVRYYRDASNEPETPDTSEDAAA